MLGRPLNKDEVVHHKDGNKRNNEPSNLEVMTQAEHAALHAQLYTNCLVVGCEGKVVARSLCDKHYCRWKRHQHITDDGTAVTVPDSTKKAA